jgi:hypothetical protein
MVPTTNDDATVCYQANLSAPDVKSPAVSGELAIFSAIPSRLRAIDGAGPPLEVVFARSANDPSGNSAPLVAAVRQKSRKIQSVKAGEI